MNKPYDKLSKRQREIARASANRAKKEVKAYILETYGPDLHAMFGSKRFTRKQIAFRMNAKLAADDTKLPSGHKLRPSDRTKSERTWYEYHQEWCKTHAALPPQLKMEDAAIKHEVWTLRQQTPKVSHREIAQRLNITEQKSRNIVRSWSAELDASYVYLSASTTVPSQPHQKTPTKPAQANTELPSTKDETMTQQPIKRVTTTTTTVTETFEPSSAEARRLMEELRLAISKVTGNPYNDVYVRTYDMSHLDLQALLERTTEDRLPLKEAIKSLS